MQQPQTAAAAAAGGQRAATFQPGGNRSLVGHSLSQEVPHKPPYVLRCRDRHLVGRVQFAGAVLSEERHSHKHPPDKTKQHNSGDRGGTGQVGRKSVEGNRTQNEKLQRDRRLWNGNTKSKQLVTKEVNNQTATKPSTPPQQGTETKLTGLFTQEEM